MAKKDLHQYEGIEKLREIVGHNATCMFHTRTAANTFDTRPMMVQQVDDGGILWLMSGRSSTKNGELQNDPWAMLTIADNGHQEYLVVEGKWPSVMTGPRRKNCSPASPRRGFRKAWMTRNSPY